MFYLTTLHVKNVFSDEILPYPIGEGQNPITAAQMTKHQRTVASWKLN